MQQERSMSCRFHDFFYRCRGLTLGSPSGDDQHRREACGHIDKVGGEVARADRRVPAAVRAGRAAFEHLERVEGAADAGAQPAAVAALLAAAQRERRRHTHAGAQVSGLSFFKLAM